MSAEDRRLATARPLVEIRKTGNLITFQAENTSNSTSLLLVAIHNWLEEQNASRNDSELEVESLTPVYNGGVTNDRYELKAFVLLTRLR
ncbi:MAG: hypothetical protein JWM56_162 [Candidatus Peribacteria bacterium]|nr:hypothetical protein [Candidatus Peribacteria bacterium]